MKNKTIIITESKLKEIIQEEVEKALYEYSIKATEYFQRLDSLFAPILDNLLCIAICRA